MINRRNLLLGTAGVGLSSLLLPFRTKASTLDIPKAVEGFKYRSLFAEYNHLEESFMCHVKTQSVYTGKYHIGLCDVKNEFPMTAFNNKIEDDCRRLIQSRPFGAKFHGYKPIKGLYLHLWPIRPGIPMCHPSSHGLPLYSWSRQVAMILDTNVVGRRKTQGLSGKP